MHRIRFALAEDPIAPQKLDGTVEVDEGEEVTDADRLEDAIRREHSTVPVPRFADEIAASIGIHPKRAIWILEKWHRKGKWESGVTERSGWFTSGPGRYHGYDEKPNG